MVDLLLVHGQKHGAQKYANSFRTVVAIVNRTAIVLWYASRILAVFTGGFAGLLIVESRRPQVTLSYFYFPSFVISITR